MATNFDGKKIAVIGMARSGLAAAEVLAGRGAEVALYDSGDAGKLASALAWAKEHGIAAHAAANVVGDVDLVVTSPGVRRDAEVLADAVRRGIPVWGEIEAAYRIAQAPILAVTGTNGKTTTTALLGEMARAAGLETYVAGNIAAGEIAMPLIRAADVAGKDAVIVAEISSFQLEWIPTFRPKVGAILNISADHLDRQSYPEYVAAKWNLFGNQQAGDFALIGDNVLAPYALKVDRLPGTLVNFRREPRPRWLRNIKLPGAHNIENVMAAVCMARRFGLPEEAIERAATTFGGVVHRLEYVDTIGGVRYINNSMCTNNVAFARSLEAISGPKVVLAGGVYKGGDITLLAKAASDRSVRKLILYGQSARMIEEAVAPLRACPTIVVATLAEAVARAAGLAESGDTVILNPGCSSFDQFKDFEDRGEQFKALVKKHAGAR